MKKPIYPSIFLASAWTLLVWAAQPPTSTRLDSQKGLTEALYSTNADSEGVLALRTGLELQLSDDQFADLDHEEFGDWMAVLPGFYPLDQAALGAPYRGLILGMDPSASAIQFRSRRMQDHLTGSADLSWIPPEALAGLWYQPLTITTASGSIDARLRSMEASPPSSRIAVRDGYYGLGTVDFDLVQKIAPDLKLNGGGRIATYGGRVPNSEGYGLNLRSEIAYRLNSEISGWGGLMQGKQNMQLPGFEGSYNRDRHEADLAIQYRNIQANLFGIQQRETYLGGESDGWDEIGWSGNLQSSIRTLQGNTQCRISAARWRLKGLSWAGTVFGEVETRWNWQPKEHLSGSAILGLDISDDFSPARHLGMSALVPIYGFLAGYAGLSQHQVPPTRFEVAADFQPGEHYLPYDALLFQNPNLDVVGDRSLKNETYTTGMTGLQINNPSLRSALALFVRRIDDPIVWQAKDENTLQPRNGEAEEARGVLGWMICDIRNRFDLGLTGSFMPRNPGEKSLFPETIAHAWAQFRQRLFKEELELRFRLGGDYWGARQAPIPGGWENWGEVLVVNGRISAYLLGVHLFWGVNNIFSQDYMLCPGHEMMHKEEVWGVAWNFRD